MCCRILLCCALLTMGCAGLRTGEEIQAEIRKYDLLLAPDGPGPFPAVHMLHGCGGLGSRDRMWVRRLRGCRYLTLRVNSLTPRGLKQVCGGDSLRPEERVPDVLAAVAFLQSRADVDPMRIALMGWSHGARATGSIIRSSALPRDAFRRPWGAVARPSSTTLLRQRRV